MINCHHGCGLEAKYQTKSGKPICFPSSNSCPEVKKKNSKGLRQAYENGSRVSGEVSYSNYSDDSKKRMNWNKGNRYANFSYNGKGNHKSALISERGHLCECCKLSTWLGEPITLELEHIDANNKNNNKENLKLLCPNCHSQTPTWKRGNYSGWKRKRYTDEEMVEAIQTSTCLNACLSKLDLRYGSAGTIVNIMDKYKVRFMGD